MRALADLAGRQYNSAPFAIGREKVRDYLAATGGAASRHPGAVPLCFAAVYAMSPALALLRDPAIAPVFPRVLHTEQRFLTTRSVRSGDEVTATGAVRRVAERFGASFLFFETAVDDATGARVAEAASTFVIRPEGDTVALPAPEARAELAAGTRLTRASPAGAVGTAISRRASRRDLAAYADAGGDRNPIHWDPDHARAQGLPGVIVHGLLLMAWAGQAVTEAVAGEGALIELAAKFKGVVLADEEVRFQATVSQPGAGRAQFGVTGRGSRGPAVTATATVAW